MTDTKEEIIDTKKEETDFKYIQFIRNVGETEDLHYIALDYFDYIKIKDMESLKE